MYLTVEYTHNEETDTWSWELEFDGIHLWMRSDFHSEEETQRSCAEFRADLASSLVAFAQTEGN